MAEKPKLNKATRKKIEAYYKIQLLKAEKEFTKALCAEYADYLNAPKKKTTTT